MSTATCPTDPANPLRIADLSNDNFADVLFNCEMFLFDREMWEEITELMYFSFVAPDKHEKLMDIKIQEALEEIRALEFRGYQFEPPSEESWVAFEQRVNPHMEIC